MQRYAVSCLVVVVLAMGCDESGTPVSPSAAPLAVKERPLATAKAGSDNAARAEPRAPQAPGSGGDHDTPKDIYGRPLFGADGPARYRSPGPDEASPTGDGVGSPAPGTSSPAQSSESRSGVALAQYTLSAYTNHPIGSWPEAVAIGDVTCDGRPDVVTTTTFYFDAARDYHVFVFPQLANGSLGTSVSYAYGANASRNGIALTDLNKDGCLDVVVGHSTGISVLLADKATGGLKPAAVVANADADTLAATDVNRDGRTDIISLGWSRGATLFYGNGTGGFAQIVPFAAKASGYNDHEVGDVNGDGIPDLAVMSGQGGAPNLSVYLHNGTNALNTTANGYSLPGSANGIGLGDVNGDGRGDVVVSKSGNSPTFLWILLQDANGNLVGPTTISSYDIPDSVQIADLDRDGDDDVVVVHGGWMKVGVYLQEAGALQPEVLYTIPYASSYAPQGLALGDFSGDGCTDVAIADYNNGLVTLYGNCPSPCAGAADGTACNDHNACTQVDTCQAGACVGASPVTCTAQDQCHVAGVCNPTTGACSNPNKADGTVCNDKNACTQADTCQAGTCTGANPVTCTAQDQCHAAGVCNPSTGVCSNPSKADGATCNDGNGCTQTDTCQAGACIGANPVTCTAQDECHVAGVCNPSTGVCSNPNKADGTACTDGNACTQTDTCQAGTCTGANPVTCTASDQCHVAGVCNPASGVCSNPNKADGAACNDANACTQTDTCQAGTCTGVNPITCTALDQCHIAGVCNPVSGTCSNPSKADGATCNDGNACTQTDSCQTGACVGASPVICAALDQCHVAGMCNPSTGVCSNPSKADGTSCNDGNACTQVDSCQLGTCTGADPVTCTALDQCHVAGVCNPVSGVCSNPNKADGAECFDGNACTQADACRAGACVGGNPIICAALDQCHVAGSCNPSTGVCSNPSKADGTVCTDGNACTQADTCQVGTCTGADPVTCAPADACHVEGVCDAATGMCSHPTKLDGAACGGGTCNEGACVPTPDAGSDGGTSDGGASDGGGTSDGGRSDGGTDIDIPDPRCGCGASDAPYLDPTWIGLGLLFAFRRRVLGPSGHARRVEARGKV